MKFNKKYTTIAFYACLVVLFAVVCVYFLLQLGEGRFSALADDLSGILLTIFIGAVIAYILNPIVNIFEYFVFVRGSSRKEALRLRKEAKARGEKLPFGDSLILARDHAIGLRRAKYEKKLEASEKKPPRKVGKLTIKRRTPKFKEHPFRGLSILCTFIVFIGALSLLVMAAAPQIQETVTRVAKMIQTFDLNGFISKIQNNETLAKGYNLAVENGFDPASLLDNLKGFLLDFVRNLPNLLYTAFSKIYSVVYSFVIGLILAIYFLFSKEMLLEQFQKLIDSFLPGSACRWIRFVVTEIDAKFGKFIEGKILDSAIIGVLAFILFSIFGVPFAALIAVIVGITNIIPFFGPFIGAIPSALIILIADPSKVILFIILVVVLQQLDGNLIGPFILGDSLDLSPVWIMLAIIIMGALMGLAGVVFGVPVFAVLFSLVKEVAPLVKKRRERRALEKGGSDDSDEE